MKSRFFLDMIRQITCVLTGHNTTNKSIHNITTNIFSVERKKSEGGREGKRKNVITEPANL